MKKVKPNEINVYWRKKNNMRYAKDKPGLQVRKATEKFLTKKQQLVDEKEEGELLENLIVKIREILK